jgi:polyhydroxybutyrate depolymerase
MIRNLLNIKNLEDGQAVVANVDYLRQLEVDGKIREYIMHVPRHYTAGSYRSDRPSPVIIDFHGGGVNAEISLFTWALYARADQEEQDPPIVIYAQGHSNRNGVDGMFFWNADPVYTPAAGADNFDDIAYTRAVLDDVENFIQIDPDRIYATGISNGGMMAYRVALEMPDVFAAVAPVASFLNYDVPDDLIDPSVPHVSVLHFNGTDDMTWPGVTCYYTDDPTDPFGCQMYRDMVEPGYVMIAWRPAIFGVVSFARLNSCDTLPVNMDLPDTADDGMTVHTKEYGGCAHGAEVKLVKITGGGHTWPGWRLQTNAKFNSLRITVLELLGYGLGSTDDISANDMIFEFFQRHPVK